MYSKVKIHSTALSMKLTGGQKQQGCQIFIDKTSLFKPHNFTAPLSINSANDRWWKWQRYWFFKNGFLRWIMDYYQNIMRVWLLNKQDWPEKENKPSADKDFLVCTFCFTRTRRRVRWKPSLRHRHPGRACAGRDDSVPNRRPEAGL